ncbi:MAG: hypothetical protein WC599_13045 [Bacteroidales bacterium]
MENPFSCVVVGILFIIILVFLTVSVFLFWIHSSGKKNKKEPQFKKETEKEETFWDDPKKIFGKMPKFDEIDE